jgi:hypothetical protein
MTTPHRRAAPLSAGANLWITMNRTAWMALSRRSLATRYGLGLCAAALLGVTLAGCGGAAYVDARREAGQKEPVGPSTHDRVAICYSASETATATVQSLAESECAKTSRVPIRAFEQRWGCTMLTPRRIFFDCVAKP